MKKSCIDGSISDNDSCCGNCQPGRDFTPICEGCPKEGVKDTCDTTNAEGKDMDEIATSDIYVVFGSTGPYPKGPNWIVAVYNDEFAANVHRAAAQRETDDLIEKYTREMLDSDEFSKIKTSFDTNFHFTPKPVFYTVERTTLFQDIKGIDALGKWLAWSKNNSTAWDVYGKT